MDTHTSEALEQSTIPPTANSDIQHTTISSGLDDHVEQSTIPPTANSDIQRTTISTGLDDHVEQSTIPPTTNSDIQHTTISTGLDDHVEQSTIPPTANSDIQHTTISAGLDDHVEQSTCPPAANSDIQHTTVFTGLDDHVEQSTCPPAANNDIQHTTISTGLDDHVEQSTISAAANNDIECITISSGLDDHVEQSIIPSAAHNGAGHTTISAGLDEHVDQPTVSGVLTVEHSAVSTGLADRRHSDSVPELPNHGGMNSEYQFAEVNVRSVVEGLASTGKYWHEWEKLKSMLSFYLKQVLSKYPEAKMDSDQQNTTLGESYMELAKRLDDALESFIEGPPFTIQRLSEILLGAQDIYPKLSKLALALEKNLLVTTTLPISSGHPNSLVMIEEKTICSPDNKAGAFEEPHQLQSDSVENGVAPMLMMI